ncbi:NUDIX hydrolase [Sulfuricella denitrificans]|nr:NUDIX hydrolase [Sulfuricella denitrificans]
MNYCSHCGAKVELRIPPGEHLPRHMCGNCGAIHYENPKMVVGAIPEWEDKILLCRRAIEPRHGFWTLPAGFMENNETTTQAAARETAEEAHARVEIAALYALYNIPHISQVHLFFRSRLLDLDFRPGSESLEVALFSEADIPWDNLAFSSVRNTLKHYFEDRRRGVFELHVGDITLPLDKKRAPEAPLNSGLAPEGG